MSEVKWTPGPWKLDDDGSCDVLANSGELLASVYPMMSAYRQRESNARLIAAAPELYEALWTLLDCLIGTTKHDLPGYVGSQDTADRIFAALAKARGEA